MHAAGCGSSKVKCNKNTEIAVPLVGFIITLIICFAIGGVEEAQSLFSKFEGHGYGYFFSLRGNPWIMPPEAVVESGMAAIKAYYTDIQMAIDAGANVISRRLLKIVLVGSSSGGKTSLMKSMISGSSNTTKGTPEEVSTEGIEMRSHQLGNTSVEFYDCAGQVDYGGMHQVFLTRRALFLLVWDIAKCSGLGPSDLDKVIHDSIMRWLYTLHLRAPGATVLLVANKIDMTSKDLADTTVETVETRLGTMLQEWKGRRGLGKNWGKYKHARSKINLLKGSSLVSCVSYTGVSTLTQRVMKQCFSSIEVPPSWELALEFINALRWKRSPVRACLEYLKLPITEENVETEWSGSFIPKEKLRMMWRSAVEKAMDEMGQTSRNVMSRLWQNFDARVTDGVTERGNDAGVNKSDSALEGALQISEFAGRILLVEDGGGVFLDVVWLSDLVKPILSHKLKYKPFPTAALGAMRDDLVKDGILRWEFAQDLWKGILPSSSPQTSERVAHALYNVLIKLGVILPLGRTLHATNKWGKSRGRQSVPGIPTQPPDMLVLMRLRETPDDEQQRLLDECTMAAVEDASEVILKWEFDSAGSPYGLMERIIASCHTIGSVERGLCWRYGALFRSGQKARLITTVIHYNTVAHFLTVRVIGQLENLQVWATLQYVASAVVLLSKEWPGVIVRGSPVCPEHPSVSSVLYLAIPDEVRIGGPLIPKAAPGARRNLCDCHQEAGKVLWRIVNELGVVVDINKDPFEESPDHERPNPGRSPTGPSESESPISDTDREASPLRDVFNLWRASARETAVGLWGLALVLFGGITTGVVEENPTLWQVCLGVMILSLVGAAASSMVFYQDTRRNTNQRDDRGRRSPPSGVAYGDV